MLKDLQTMAEKQRINKESEKSSKESQFCKFGNDQVEQKIQVDRKPLHGSEKSLPSAEEFFLKVTELSGALITWPTRLKIDAKTKKDPYVKISGTVDQVNCARQLIASTLRIKRDKVSLRIEIPHCDHSKIIGRKGKNTQDVMRETMCHIHFPDSNRIHELEKNNQVSLSGTVQQVEKARQRLRKLSPLCIICELSNTHRYCYQELQRVIGHPNIFISLREERNGKVKCILKGIEQNEIEMVKAMMVLANMSHLKDDQSLYCQTVISSHYCLETILYSGSKKKEMQWIAEQTSTHIIQSDTAENGLELYIFGPIAGVLTARKYIMVYFKGLLPVSVQFDRILEFDYDLIDKADIEAKFGVTVSEKWRKSRTISNVTLVVLTGSEMNISMLYQARERILNLVQNSSNIVPDVFESFKNGQILNVIKNMRMKAQQSLDLRRLTEATVSRSATEILQNRYAQITPNPDDSPIAHSLLTGVKQIDMSRNVYKRFSTREQLLLKANRAIYNGTSAKVRQPTDLWVGYGFSNSLPADILRNGLNVFDYTAGQHHERSNMEQDANHINSMTQRSITPLAGLASVLEEDEHSDEVQQNSNSLISSLSTHKFQLFQPNQFQTPFTTNGIGGDFSASTGAFDSSSLIGNDFVWDIRIFVDPAMVLAQLNCSEYLPQFRDQEIDMEAFLLLNKQNLKDIGVSTMGARKKIYNAILRLRSSARMYGMQF
ncbi:unnamed protein product [Thelazia callipaeda]|uniref:SAM domain-containing protein n=1 Tax=Thelazia callipaeda TaxID=103827 RepID=A0A0N5D3M0_THECL|nr:unnamed protein product [Thelazia callipaeda]